MNQYSNILNLYRKIICSLLCISKNSQNERLKIKSNQYLSQILEQYKLWMNQKICFIDNSEEIIIFCNECYLEKDIFDFAEDVEYGVEELMKIIIEKS